MSELKSNHASAVYRGLPLALAEGRSFVWAPKPSQDQTGSSVWPHAHVLPPCSQIQSQLSFPSDVSLFLTSGPLHMLSWLGRLTRPLFLLPLHQVSVGPDLPQGASTSHRTRSKPTLYIPITAHSSPSLTAMTGIPPSMWIFLAHGEVPVGRGHVCLAHPSTSQDSTNSEQKLMMMVSVMQPLKKPTNVLRGMRKGICPMTKEVTDMPFLRHSDHTRGFVLGARQKQLMWGRNSKPDPPKNIKGTEHTEAGQETGELWPLDANIRRTLLRH